MRTPLPTDAGGTARHDLHLPDAPGDPPGPSRAAVPSAAWPWSRGVPLADESPNPELVDMSRRFWVGLVLSLPIFLVAMSDMLLGQPLLHAWA